MIHNRTMTALSMASIGGYLGGSIDSFIVGITVAAVSGAAAIYYTPHAETVAIQWRDRQAENSGNAD